ncbi:MAG: GNAT family N-acetyltransferase [Mycobacteriales bacterium]
MSTGHEDSPPEWTPAAVAAAAARWRRWAPPESALLDTGTEEVSLLHSEATVCRAEPAGRTAAEIVDIVLALAGDCRATIVTWPLLTGTDPPGLAEALEAYGARVVGERELLGYPLAGPGPDLAPPADVTCRPVIDRAGLRTSAGIKAASRGLRRPPDDVLAMRAADLLPTGRRAPVHFLYLADLAGRCAGTGGYTLRDDRVCRLWGGGVLPEFRRRGVYRRLVADRVAAAHARGATLALAKARAGTSAPILLRAGFTHYGREIRYRLRLDDPPSDPIPRREH